MVCSVGEVVGLGEAVAFGGADALCGGATVPQPVVTAAAVATKMTKSPRLDRPLRLLVGWSVMDSPLTCLARFCCINGALKSGLRAVSAVP